MQVLEKAVRSRCEQCGILLESDALGCLNCLLGGGLGESENRRFQHYELCLREGGNLDELGRGAMGITYRARDLNLDSVVALKLISDAYSKKVDARERFRREARAAAQLRHPNVASVFHFGETAEGQCFYAMELVEGETLEARVRRDGSLTASATLDVAEQVARALVAAEGHGLVHRDLKPSNVMLVSNEVSMDAPLVKVIDFGLARAALEAADGTAPHPTFSGTPEFASPEQFDSTKLLDARSDIYSLGVTLWYLLCGQSPFSGDASDGSGERRLPMEQLGRAKVPPPLVALLRCMLAANPAQRPQSARALLSAVRDCRVRIERKPLGLVLGVCALAFIIASGLWLKEYRFRRELARGPASGPPQEKSVAVLPFENLSADKNYRYFVTGMQEDTLSGLAKIADLKVISYTSVEQYRGDAPRNLREIGRALGVAHVLEGSVQRIASRARINVQLIDTRTNAHLWAETYDRDLADVFAAQSEIARKIAEQLKAQLSPAEKAAIAKEPTKDLAAFNLYVEAASLIDQAGYGEGQETKRSRAVELLGQAIARDPSFLLAYCRLAEAHDTIYFQSQDHTPARLALAKAAIDSAFKSQPDSGEAHLALATHYYRGYFDYDRARDELEIARRTLPNNSRVFDLSGLIDRRQNRWHDAVRNLNRAVELDPQNAKFLTDLAITYRHLRDYQKVREFEDRLTALNPNPDVEMEKAWRVVWEKGDTRALDAVLRARNLSDNDCSLVRFQLALWDRDAATAQRLLPVLLEDDGDNIQILRVGYAGFSRNYLQGLIARMKGDDGEARLAFTAARSTQERLLRDTQHLSNTLVVLGLIDAALGRKEDALREGRRAAELAVPEKNALDAADTIYYYGVICAWVGEPDLAIEQLQASAKMPAGVEYKEMRLDPHWDLIRDDPRFEKLAASLKPKA